MPRYAYNCSPVFRNEDSNGSSQCIFGNKKRRNRPADCPADSRKRARLTPAVSPTFRVSSHEVNFDVNHVYQYNLQKTGRYFEVGSTYILADCDSSGNLLKHYVTVQRQQTHTEDVSIQHYVLNCECKTTLENRRLSSTNMIEHQGSCIHCKVAEKLFRGPVVGAPVDDEPLVKILSEEPFLAAVRDTDDVAVVTFSNYSRQLQCMQCKYGKHSCHHVEMCRAWLADNDCGPAEGFEEPPRSNFKSVSHKRISYPLPEQLKQTFAMYESGMKTFPVFLIPRVDPDFPTCVNGHDWDTSDPVQMGWILGNATIHKETTSITHSWSEGESKQIQVCYRLCCGTCKCRMFYDGQEDLLFNLNNKDLVHYSLLLNYLHHMLEGRNPLAACHRAFAKNHAVLSNATPLHIQKLRLAWNAFARLLNIDFTSVFQCHTCGPVPDIIICDGTSIGCRKSYLKPYLISQDTPSTEPVRGSQHKDRTLLLQKKTRFALFQYSQTKASLTQGEFNSMISQLRKEKNGKPIADFIILSDDNRQPPNYCRDILKDLSRNSPVCALAQSNDVGRIISLLSQAGSGAISRILSALKREVPIIGDWLYHVTQLYRPLPGCVYDLLLLISRCIAETYNHECDDSVDDNPASSACDDLMYFPALPMLHRNRKYARDVNKPDTDACKKFSRGHPTLSPGIFTLFCPHKICYGFQLLLSHESPEHPFSIFKTRFEVAPKLIVYDNACKLHQYCLNREPVFFQNTIFCVDRLHWKNHKGCSSGYNLDTYENRYDITSINSQVNEQANAMLCRIKAQVSYMLPDNFMFHTSLFLALHNMDQLAKIQEDSVPAISNFGLD